MSKLKIKNSNINNKDLNEILKRIYDSTFFEDVKVEVQNKTLIINLKEYPIINQIIIRGEPSKKISEEVRKNLRLKEKNSFIKSYLADDIDIIKKLLLCRE